MKYRNCALSLFTGIATLLLFVSTSGCRNTNSTISESETTIATTLVTSTQPVIPLALEVTAPQNDVTFNVNLQKVTGTVSDPTATVKVNDAEARVSPDGSFYGFVDLPPGSSTIEILAMRGIDSVSKEVTATFKPPLALFLDDPQTMTGVDYRVTPLNITGYVNYPQAVVTVNDKLVSVSSDGHFSTQVMLSLWPASGGVLKGISGTASLNGQADSDGWGIGVTENGSIMVSPGSGLNRMMWFSFEKHVINLTNNDSETVTGFVSARKNIETPAAFSVHIFSIPGNVIVNPPSATLPTPTGLSIKLEQGNFLLYPNVIYDISLLVETTKTLPAGGYWSEIDFASQNGLFLDSLEVIVGAELPASATVK